MFGSSHFFHFIQQGHIKLIKSVRKDMYYCSILKVIFLLMVFFIKESWEKNSTNIWRTCFLSSKSSY